MSDPRHPDGNRCAEGMHLVDHPLRWVSCEDLVDFDLVDFDLIGDEIARSVMTDWRYLTGARPAPERWPVAALIARHWQDYMAGATGIALGRDRVPFMGGLYHLPLAVAYSVDKAISAW